VTGSGKIRLALIALAIQGEVAACGLYTPDKDPFTSDAPVPPDHKFSRQGSYESGLVDHVTCEVSRGLAETVKQWPGVSALGLGTDWGTAVTLSMTVEDQTGVSPGITFLQPLRNVVFPFATGGNVTSPQSFSFSLGGTASVNALRTEIIQYTFKNKDAIKFQKCGDTGSGVLIDGDLKIREFLFDKAQIVAAGNGLWDPKLKSKISMPYNAWTEEITFVAAYGGTATPTWKLARVSANASSNLLVTERTNTNDLILTLGPIDPCTLAIGDPDRPQSLSCPPTTLPNSPLSLTASAMNQHNARVSANAIAVSITGQSH
jgi:hypothetical protein